MKYLGFLVLAWSLLAMGMRSAYAAQLPSFALKDMVSGSTFDSAKIEKPMLVEFYYNSCPACNDNADKVSMIAKEFIATAQVVDFGYDCKQSSYESWIMKHKPKHPVLMGCDSPIFDSVPVTAYPTTLIVDKNKNIVYKTVGSWSTSKMNTIRAKLRQLSK